MKLTRDRVYAAVTDSVVACWRCTRRPCGHRAPGTRGAGRRGRPRAPTGVPAICALGVSVPGDVVTRDGVTVVEVSQFLGWRDVPLSGLLEVATGLATHTSNDVDALTRRNTGSAPGPVCGPCTRDRRDGRRVRTGDERRGVRGVPRAVRSRRAPAGVRRRPGLRRRAPRCVSSYLPSSVIVENAGAVGASYDEVVERHGRGSHERSRPSVMPGGPSVRSSPRS